VLEGDAGAAIAGGRAVFHVPVVVAVDIRTQAPVGIVVGKVMPNAKHAVGMAICHAAPAMAQGRYALIMVGAWNQMPNKPLHPILGSGAPRRPSAG
jgi:hypothetical protein